MAGLTASGIGSGLDISSLISQLMTIEQQPLTALSTRKRATRRNCPPSASSSPVLNAAERGRTLTDAAKFTATKASVASDAPFSATSSASATAAATRSKCSRWPRNNASPPAHRPNSHPARAISRSPSARSRAGSLPRAARPPRR